MIRFASTNYTLANNYSTRRNWPMLRKITPAGNLIYIVLERR